MTKKARFRIRVADGDELALDTLDAFVQKVRSGEISPYDLVFDGLTGEWAPARSHPAFRLSGDPLVADGSGEPNAEGGSASVSLDGWMEGDGPRLDLVDAQPTPEEEARAFIARMEVERRAQDDDGLRHLSLVDSRSETLGGIIPSTPNKPRNPYSWARSRPYEAPVAVPEYRGTTLSHRGMQPARSKRAGWRWAAYSVVLCLGLAATATVAWPALRTGGGFPGRSIDETTRGSRRVLPTESAIRDAAAESFVSSIDRLRRQMGVGTVPSAWLDGKYLADPKAYPSVDHYWTRYLNFVESVHEREGELYRDAYLGAATRAGLAGPMRSLRMAGAAGDFEAERASRDALYAQVWRLAASALALHETLISLEGRVSYEPLRGPRVSADPVIEAVGTDPEAQARLEQALDRVLAAIAPIQRGEVTTEGVRVRAPMWLVDGMKDITSP